MSASPPSPASDPGVDPQAPGIGTESDASSVSDAPGTDAPTASQPFDPEALPDDLKKVYAGGEEGIEITKNWQRKFSRANSERDDLNRKIGGLAPFLEQLGGDGVVEYLNRYVQMKNDPRFAAALGHLETTGTLPARIDGQADTDTDDEYMDPAVKNLTEQLAEATATIRSLESRVNQVTSKQGVADLASNFERFWKEGIGPHLTEEDRTTIRDGVTKAIKQWDATETGRAALASLSYDSIRPLCLSQLTDEAISAAGERLVRQKSRDRSERSTEVAPGVRTTGSEPSATAMTALQAWNEAQRRIT